MEIKEGAPVKRLAAVLVLVGCGESVTAPPPDDPAGFAIATYSYESAGGNLTFDGTLTVYQALPQVLGTWDVFRFSGKMVGTLQDDGTILVEAFGDGFAVRHWVRRQSDGSFNCEQWAYLEGGIFDQDVVIGSGSCSLTSM